jgi:hypothetical protein
MLTAAAIGVLVLLSLRPSCCEIRATAFCRTGCQLLPMWTWEASTCGEKQGSTHKKISQLINSRIFSINKTKL